MGTQVAAELAHEHREEIIFSDACTFASAVDLTTDDGAADTDATGPVSNLSIAANANKRIGHAKTHQRIDLNGAQPDGQDVASKTQLLLTAAEALTLRAFTLRPTLAPTGGDKQYTVDLQQQPDGGGSWTSLLSAPLTIDNATANDTAIAAALISSPQLAAGAALRLVVTASGTTGNQGQGFGWTAALET
jgi:hypothetical protein